MEGAEQELHSQDLATAMGIIADLRGLDEAIETHAESFRTWQSGVACALAKVQVAWAAHTRVDEDPEGFLAAARRDAPRLGHRLEVQRDEHVELADALAAAQRDLLAHSPTESAATAREQLREVSTRIDRHLHDADCLAWEIANEDIGSGD